MADSLFPRGIFSSRRAAWIALLVYTAILLSTLTLTYDLYLAAFRSLGKANVSALLYAIFMITGLLLALFSWKRLDARPGAFLTLALIGVIMYYAMILEDVPANRIHFLQYCPLAVLCLEVVRHYSRDRYVYIWTLLLVTLIGALDELVQGMLPGRHFDPKDVVLNSLAGVLTLAYVGFVMGSGSYPYGSSAPREHPDSAAGPETD